MTVVDPTNTVQLLLSATTLRGHPTLANRCPLRFALLIQAEDLSRARGPAALAAEFANNMGTVGTNQWLFKHEKRQMSTVELCLEGNDLWFWYNKYDTGKTYHIGFMFIS